jgi:hypothetical protein
VLLQNSDLWPLATGFRGDPAWFNNPTPRIYRVSRSVVLVLSSCPTALLPQPWRVHPNPVHTQHLLLEGWQEGGDSQLISVRVFSHNSQDSQ